MLQTETERYNARTLLQLNESYDCDHSLSEWDVAKVNNLVERIESSRSATKPEAGDRLLYTSKHGDYSPVAFIEKNRNGELFVCVKPMTPFAELSDGIITYDVSGGPFTGMHEGELKYAGTVDNPFKTWGHGGPKANGAVYFLSEVSLWEYAEAEPLFGDFTTKTWRKITLGKTKDPAAGYLYKGDGFVFEDENAYQNFLDTFCATVFPGYGENQLVIWCYRDVLKGLPVQEWEAVNAPVTTRKIGTLPTEVKVQKDDKSHKILTFYVRPE
jgi:hypothetical protein